MDSLKLDTGILKTTFVVVVAALSIAPAGALSVEVEGNKYPPTVSVEGKTLKLVGAGLREKWMFDVYTLGAYTESASCKPGQLISKDEVKYLRLDMMRDVSAEKMAEVLNEAFDNNMPKDATAELKTQVKTFLGYFKKECTTGTKLELTYVPGKGTTLKQNGQLQGPAIPGRAFAPVLWSCYFSNKTCCSDLKAQVLRHCK